jgi:hypothetical protein
MPGGKRRREGSTYKVNQESRAIRNAERNLGVMNSLNLFKRLVGAVVVLLLGVFISPAASAQYETASVLGFVHDSSGAAIPNAKVTLVNMATGVEVTVTADAQGQFTFTSVRIGQYRVKAEATGFSATQTEAFNAEVNARQRVDVNLKPGAATETVTVTGAAALLNTEDSERGQIISARDVNNLPLNGRAYADLALLTPGVRANNLENQTVTSRDASYNVNGQRSEFNNFMLDGLDNNAYGTSNQSFSNQAIQPSPDAIGEFRVSTDNYSAEYGRASGAVFNVSIKSGGNQIHGKLWEYNRNTAFNAIGPFTPPTNALTGLPVKPVLVKNQFGGAVGGPVPLFLRGKIFYFGDYESNRQVQGQYSAKCQSAPGHLSQHPHRPTCTAAQSVYWRGVRQRRDPAVGLEPSGEARNSRSAYAEYCGVGNVGHWLFQQPGQCT